MRWREEKQGDGCAKKSKEMDVRRKARRWIAKKSKGDQWMQEKQGDGYEENERDGCEERLQKRDGCRGMT